MKEIILLLIILVGCISSEKSIEKTAGESIEYDYSPEKFEAALSSRNPIVLEFAADWCIYCWEMLPTMRELKKEYSGKVNFLTANFDEEKELAQKYGIDSLPAFVFFNNKGEVEKKFIGYLSKKGMEREIELLLK
jgi:thioredoxin 1